MSYLPEEKRNNINANMIDDKNEYIHEKMHEIYAEQIQRLAHDYLDFSFHEHEVHSLARYGSLLLAWNETTNLTALREPSQVIIKHFFDSALVSKKLEDLFVSKAEAPPRVFDIGTGAGFPGMVIKIMQPSLHMTLVDASAKKVAFLAHLAQELNMDVQCLQERAEDLGRQPDFRGQADAVVSRAVAELPVLLEYTIPLLKVGGYLIASKGRKTAEEVERAEGALKALGAHVENIVEFALSPEAEHRSLIIIRKILPTSSRYPRRAGQPKKNPL